MDLCQKLVLANPCCTHSFCWFDDEAPTKELEGYNFIKRLQRYVPKDDSRLLWRDKFNVCIIFENGKLHDVSSDMLHFSSVEFWRDFNPDNPVVPEFLNKILTLIRGDNWSETIAIEIMVKNIETRKLFLESKNKLN